MSSKKSKLDLLFKVRYQNPLPPPPFPPKLLHIPTTPSRYAGPDFTASLANEAPLPMVVDAELGMPLDLSVWDCLWEEGADDSALNPDPNNPPPVDPRDEFMLGDSPMFSYANGNSHSSGAPSTPQVSWLRRTEYISSHGSLNKSSSNVQDTKHLTDDPVDISIEGQIRDIEASFEYSTKKFDLANLKHPNKPNLTAVDSYEILPDVSIWANAYDLFRFAERPGDRPVTTQDPRLDCALLRPMESDGEHFLAYYLPKSDAIAEDYKNKREKGLKANSVQYSFVRDYETAKIEKDVPNEFLLVLDDGDDNAEPSEDPTQNRGKGAFYKGIERKIAVKKKRANWDTYTDKWDAVHLILAPLSEEEIAERREAIADVTDPLAMFSRTDADAEGEVDDTEMHNASDLPPAAAAATTVVASASASDPNIVDVNGSGVDVNGES